MTHYEEPTQDLIKKHEELGYYPKPDDFEPIPTYPEWHHWHGRPRCQAWNPRRGRQCRGLAMVSLGINRKTGKPFDKCKGCGGRSLRGVDSPSLKTGIYSQYMPVRLADRYLGLMNDPEILSMKSRIQLLETRVIELLENLDEEGSFAIFKQLQFYMGEYEKYIQLASQASGDRARNHRQKAVTALTQVSDLINTGVDEEKKWQEIQSIFETIRKLADTEQKQLRASESMVMIDRVMLFATTMGSIFRDIILSVEKLTESDKQSIIINLEEEVTNLLEHGDYANTAVIDISEQVLDDKD